MDSRGHLQVHDEVNTMAIFVRGIVHCALCMLVAACVPIGVRVQNMYSAASPSAHGTGGIEVRVAGSSD
jgi:hypothetical protein